MVIVSDTGRRHLSTADDIAVGKRVRVETVCGQQMYAWTPGPDSRMSINCKRCEAERSIS